MNEEWKNILKVDDELEKGKIVDSVENVLAYRKIKFQNKMVKKSFIEINKQYMQNHGVNRANKTYFYILAMQKFNENKIPLSSQDVQEIKNEVEEGQVRGKKEAERRQAIYNHNVRRQNYY